MNSAWSPFQTQKPRIGLLIVGSVLLLSGAGCEAIDSARYNVDAATTAVREKMAEIQTTIESAQKTYEKAQAIYDILHEQPSTSESTTPSVQPSEDQPQPAIEENTSSQ